MAPEEGYDDARLRQVVAGSVAEQVQDDRGVEPWCERCVFFQRLDGFQALRQEVANWRWQGVPFVLRTGKRLPRRVSEIAIFFRQPPVEVFRPFQGAAVHPNVLTLRLQPDEGVELQFEIKTPGEDVDLTTTRLHFRYDEIFERRLPEAYETLLLDVMTGDQTLFVRSDEVEASWQLYEPLLDPPDEPEPYPPAPGGRWGPTGCSPRPTTAGGRRNAPSLQPCREPLRRRLAHTMLKGELLYSLGS